MTDSNPARTFRLHLQGRCPTCEQTIPADRDTASDLGEFLLARIAEEEAAAERAVILRTKSGLGWTGPTPAEATMLVLSGHRLLAECAAKRVIVRLWEETEEGTYGDQGPTIAAEAAYALAAVYADHPDYDEAWRP